MGRGKESAVNDLATLAREYVTLSDLIAIVRDAIRKLLLNGGDGDASVRPTPARSKPGVKGPRLKHPNAQLAAEAEQKIIDLLKTRPVRMAEIATEMGAKQTTTSERVRRLRERGLIVPVEGGGWTASA